MLSASLRGASDNAPGSEDSTTSELDHSAPRREMAAFVEHYSSNKSAVTSLANLIVMPPISAERQLPPDTTELLQRARLGKYCWCFL